MKADQAEGARQLALNVIGRRTDELAGWRGREAKGRAIVATRVEHSAQR